MYDLGLINRLYVLNINVICIIHITNKPKYIQSKILENIAPRLARLPYPRVRFNTIVPYLYEYQTFGKTDISVIAFTD